MRFLGVDLAWTVANPSGVVALEGERFPLRLVEGPATLPTHAAVLDWLVDGLRHPGRGTATAVGIDEPLEYSNVSPGFNTGCSPTTPMPRTSCTWLSASVMIQWRLTSCAETLPLFVMRMVYAKT